MIVMPQMMLIKYAKPKGERRVTELCAQIMTYGIDAGPPTRSCVWSPLSCGIP